MFWLFYQQGLKDKATIIADIGKALVHTADLTAPNQDKGVIQITPPDTTHAPHTFALTGLKPGTQYSFFVRIIHPETAAADPTKPNADERAKYARDTAVTHGTSSPTGWYVSTLAIGFKFPIGIAATTDGNTLYVADTYNHQIKMIAIDKDGTATVTTIAGSTEGYKDTAKGETGKDAQFKSPHRVTLAPDGNTLYVADTFNRRIREIALGGDFPVTTVKTIGVSKGIVATTDALYVTDIASQSIKKIALPAGKISTFATGFQNPNEIIVTTDALYVADIVTNNIYKITLPGGKISTFATGFRNPQGIALVPKGNTLYVAGKGNHVIKQLTLNKDGSLKATTIIAGNGTAVHKDGVGTAAQFNTPIGIALNKDGTLYVVERDNHRIRKLEYKEAK